jgi:hypothetical protein
MTKASPLLISAVDDVIADKDTRAEWSNDEMRSALLAVQKGETMETAAEGRDLSAGAISRANTRVEDRLEELRTAADSGESLFNDPVAEAIEGFEDFFSRMEDKYGIEVNNIAVQLMIDEIQDNGQLPTARSFQGFLSSINSGINDDKIWLLTRRYESWLNNYSGSSNSSDFGALEMGMGGGQDVSGSDTQRPRMGGGVGLGGQQGVMPQEGPNAQQQSDPRIDALQEELGELKEMLKESSEETKDVGTVTVEQDDGTTVTLPADHPRAVQLLNQGSQDDSPDMMEMLSQAKEAGLIVTPSDLQSMDDGGDDLEETVTKLESLGLINDDSNEQLANAIQMSVSELGAKQLEAQQQMSQNFQSVVSEMRDVQQETQEELTLADVEDVIESKLTKSETESLRNEMESKFEDLQESISSRNRPSREGRMDPDFLKTDREMEFREKQLDAINENLTSIPKEVAEGVRDGILPALKEVKMLQEVSDEPLFTPPIPQPRAQPTYNPQEPERPAQAQQRPQPQEQPERSYGRQSDASDDEADRARPSPSDEKLGEETPKAVTEDDAEDVREKLGLAEAAGSVGASE